MPIFRAHELHAFLERLGRSAKRSLSQNFLIDGNIARKIIETLHPEEGDTILEIGPGPGVLTEILLSGVPQPVSHVIAIEKDGQFAQELSRFQALQGPSLHVFEGDALELSIQEILSRYLPSGKKAKLVSNLPYHLTTPILEKIIPQWQIFSSVTVMVQHEVGKKIVAAPATKEYSFLSLFHAYHTDKVQYSFFVPKGCFSPSPNVDSCIVHMTLRNTPLLPPDKEEQFFQIVQKAFSMRRKTIRHSLKASGYTAIDTALHAAQFSQTVRPEELSLPDWLRLYQCMDH